MKHYHIMFQNCITTKPVNYAFNGYGPHQFLSKIENSHTSEIKECKEISLIYFYINDHIKDYGKKLGR